MNVDITNLWEKFSDIKNRKDFVISNKNNLSYYFDSVIEILTPALNHPLNSHREEAKEYIDKAKYYDSIFNYDYDITKDNYALSLFEQAGFPLTSKDRGYTEWVIEHVFNDFEERDCVFMTYPFDIDNHFKNIHPQVYSVIVPGADLYEKAYSFYIRVKDSKFGNWCKNDLCFSLNDKVTFMKNDKQINGKIVNINNKFSQIKTNNNKYFNVPNEQIRKK